MTLAATYARRERRIPAVLVLVAVLFALSVTAVRAATDGPGDYGSPAVLQLGYGPGGPAADTARATASAERTTEGEYGSPAVVQLGYGPAGPPADARR